MCRVCFADLHPTSQCPFTYYSSNILSVKVITASYAKAAETGKEVVEGKQQQAEKEKLSKRAERKERPRDDQARKAKVKKREQCEAKRERDRHCEKEQEKECEREHEKELDRQQEKEKHHRRHRDDHDDSRKEHRRDDRPGERGDRECDHDRSASDRSSHPHHGFFLESSSDDNDEGWTKVSYRKSKSRSH